MLTARNTVRLLVAAALALALAGIAASDAKPFARTLVPVDAPTIVKIAKLREKTNRWRTVMGLQPLRHEHDRRSLAAVGDGYRNWVLGLWKRRATRTKRTALRPPHYRSWLCIHRHEGPWNARTGNGYYGGLQMDLDFQRTYGAHLLRTKGTADRWTPLEQIWVAVKAHRSGRGFHPWPNTARMCGLL